MTDIFEVAQSGGVARVTIERVEVSNALRPSDMRELALLLEHLDQSSQVAVIVLTGSGERAFCAGLDLNERAMVADNCSPDHASALAMLVQRGLAMTKPLIGRINGACVGGGMGLLGMCSFAISSCDARFGFPEIQHGLLPYVALAAWSGSLSTRTQRFLALSGELIGANEARQLDMVQAVVPPQDLDRTTDRICQNIVNLNNEISGLFSLIDNGTKQRARSALAKADQLLQKDVTCGMAVPCLQ